MRLALDTNILAYAEGVNGSARRQAILEILEKLPQENTFVPVQALGELFHVLTRKASRSPEKARLAIHSWRDAFSLIETSPEIMLGATDLAVHHQLGIWDSVILCGAAAAGCRLLLSEDLQSGFTWNGVTIANPFSQNMHPLLSGLLEE